MPRWRYLVAVVLAIIVTGSAAPGAPPFTLDKTFNAPIVKPSAHFGDAVAIDGNNVLISALFYEMTEVGVGQAYLFDALSGNLLHTFDDPTVTMYDSFGQSVAIDGNSVLIGAFNDDTNGPNIGQAHLFDALSGKLLQTFDDPTPPHGKFGWSVALDGNNVLIGAYLDDTRG